VLSSRSKEEIVIGKAELKTRDLIRKQMLDLRWTGGKIAELLNEDQSLKELMLREQVGKIEIKPDKKKPYVRIHYTRYIYREFPSEKVFECYNTIAKHLRKLLQ
jgi:hypothetical protein